MTNVYRPSQENENPELATADHRRVINDFTALTLNPAWQLLMSYLEADVQGALARMKAAKSGDEALQASTAYVVLCGLRDLPGTIISGARSGLTRLENEKRKL